MLQVLLAMPVVPDISYLIYVDAGWICCFRHAISSYAFDIFERTYMVSSGSYSSYIGLAFCVGFLLTGLKNLTCYHDQPFLL